MRKTIITIVAAMGIAFAATPAKAQFWGGGYYPGFGYGGFGYGGWGYGGAAIAGMAVGGLIAGAIASQSYGYGYGYGYPGYAAAPVYSSPRVRKQIIIKNSPGARVYEEDDIFGW